MIVFYLFSNGCCFNSIQSGKGSKAIDHKRETREFWIFIYHVSESYYYLRINESISGINLLEEREVFRESIENT